MDELKINSPTVKPLEASGAGVVWQKKPALIFILVVILGLVTGYGIYVLKSNGTTLIAGKNIEVVNTGTEEGVKDAATFRDTAEGTLVVNKGEITDEGTHILDRGDDSQNAYLISTVVDLNKYSGKKVQVWGETYKGQTAGWLMDVGRIKVL